MPGRLLLDAGPASGPHGARGIGSYVRGMVESIAEWPPERRERVWAVGLPGRTLAEFGDRGIAARSLLWRPFDAGVVFGRLAIGRASKRAGAGAIHATDPHRPWLPGGVRRIVTAYDLIPLREPAMVAAWRPHDRFIYRRYLRQIECADLIVAISHATADDLVERLGISPDRVRVVYPTVRAGAALVRTTPPEPTFLWVGAPDIHKQSELAVRALAAFRHANGAGQLRFIGPSSAAASAGLLGLAASLGVASFVRNRGPDIGPGSGRRLRLRDGVPGDLEGRGVRSAGSGGGPARRARRRGRDRRHPRDADRGRNADARGPRCPGRGDGVPAGGQRRGRKLVARTLLVESRRRGAVGRLRDSAGLTRRRPARRAERRREAAAVTSRRAHPSASARAECGAASPRAGGSEWHRP